MKWYAPIFISLMIDGLVSYGRMLVKRKKFQWRLLATMAVGVGCALVFQVDLFEIAGISAIIPYIGEILTGIMLSRGSSYVFELYTRLEKARAKAARLEIPQTGEADAALPEEGLYNNPAAAIGAEDRVQG